MKDILLKILSLILWTWFLVSSILFTPIILILWVVTFWFDKNLRIVHMFSCFWGAQYIWVNPLWRLKIIDRDKFDDREARVVISNHQSLVDIIVIYSLFRHFRWTSKAENFRLPFVGWVLSLNRSLKIYRGRAEAFGHLKEQAKEALNGGNSILVFPEGTRSKDGNLRNFRDGAFRIAHEMKADIQPLVLEGTSKAIPKKGWSLRGKQRIILKVMGPVSYSDIENLSLQETKQKFHEMISHELQGIRNGLTS